MGIIPHFHPLAGNLLATGYPIIILGEDWGKFAPKFVKIKSYPLWSQILDQLILGYWENLDAEFLSNK